MQGAAVTFGVLMDGIEAESCPQKFWFSTQMIYHRTARENSPEVLLIHFPIIAMFFAST